MAIDVNSKNNTFEFKRIYQISMTTSGWKLGEDYTLALRVTDASGAERKAEFGTAVNWGKTDISCLFVVGDTVSVTATPIAEVHPNFNAATASKTPTMNDSLSLTCKKFVAVKVTAPEGSTIDAGTLTKYYVFSFLEPFARSVEDGTATFHLDKNTDYFYRVRHPQGATYWNYVRLTADAAYTVTDEDLGLTGDFNKSTTYHFENNVHDRAGIYLNINTKGYKNMSVGDTFELNSFRNWFAIESYMNSKVALPEMHYQVIDENGNPSTVVSITPNELNSNVAVMEAKKEGTAIVLVTYDAMTHMNGQTSTASHRFSAIWPELTGVFVVTVGADGSSFADVKSGVYYERAVIWAAANGIVTGTGSASFSPDAKVTREQLAAILYRYAQYRKLDTSANAKLNGFSDADNVSGYASAALGWAVAEGLVNGASGRLMPKGNATRAQVAAIFHRFVENVMN